jgi:predicted amidohydrolase YtcJ
VTADRLFIADRVYTSATDRPRSWIVVRNGEVVSAGDGDPPAGDETLRFDGKTIFPGFVDAHVHLSWTGLATDGLDLSAARSREQLLALARMTLDGHVVGLGFDETRWEDRRLPTIEELDELAPSVPLVLPRIDTYMCVANSAAIRAAGIDDRRGVERDPAGRVTGPAAAAIAGRRAADHPRGARGQDERREQTKRSVGVPHAGEWPPAW